MKPIIAYLLGKGLQIKGQCRSNGDLNYIFDCCFCGAESNPRANKKRLVVSEETGQFLCNSCQKKGNSFTFKKHFGESDPISPMFKKFGTRKSHDLKIKFKEKEKVFPYQDVEKMHSALFADEPSLAYMITERGMTEKTLKDFKIGLKMFGREKFIALPSFRDNECVMMKYRSVAGKDFRREAGFKSQLFNFDMAATSDKSRVIICESEIDCMTLQQYGYDPVISASAGAGSFPDEWREDLVDFNEILFAYDSDQAGIEGAVKAAEELGRYRCKMIEMPQGWKDANECLVNGVTKEEMDFAIIHANDFDLNQIMHISEEIRQLADMQSEKSVRGIPTGWDDWNDMIGGYRPGELIIVTGATGSGKSSWTMDQSVNLAKNDEGILLGSFENTKLQTVSTLISQISEKKHSNMTREEKYELADEVQDMPFYTFKSRGEVNVQEIRESIEFGIRRYKLKMTVLDNLDFLIGGGNAGEKNTKINDVVMALKKLCTEFSTTIALVCHPKSTEARDDGTERQIDLGDIKGSSSIKQLADLVVRVERQRSIDREQNSDVVLSKITSLKCRSDQGKEGSIILQFDDKCTKFRSVPNSAEMMVEFSGTKRGNKRAQVNHDAIANARRSSNVN